MFKFYLVNVLDENIHEVVIIIIILWNIIVCCEEQIYWYILFIKLFITSKFYESVFFKLLSWFLQVGFIFDFFFSFKVISLRSS